MGPTGEGNRIGRLTTTGQASAAQVVETPTARPLRIVFAFTGLQGRLRFRDAVIEGLVERGHHVHVVLEQEVGGVVLVHLDT